MDERRYSSVEETRRIFDLVNKLVPLPKEISELHGHVTFEATRNSPYFPIPFKETEVPSALKAIEGSVACAIQNLKECDQRARRVTVSLEKTTAFLCQAYLATVGGYGKLDGEVKKFLKGEHLDN